MKQEPQLYMIFIQCPSISRQYMDYLEGGVNSMGNYHSSYIHSPPKPLITNLKCPLSIDGYFTNLMILYYLNTTAMLVQCYSILTLMLHCIDFCSVLFLPSGSGDSATFCDVSVMGRLETGVLTSYNYPFQYRHSLTCRYR